MMNAQSTLRRVGAIPLTMAPVDQPLLLRSVTAGRDMQTRLASLGLYPGTRLTVISRSHEGPCIVIVKESRMVLDRETAHRVLVG